MTSLAYIRGVPYMSYYWHRCFINVIKIKPFKNIVFDKINPRKTKYCHKMLIRFRLKGFSSTFVVWQTLEFEAQTRFATLFLCRIQMPEMADNMFNTCRYIYIYILQFLGRMSFEL